MSTLTAGRPITKSSCMESITHDPCMLRVCVYYCVFGNNVQKKYQLWRDKYHTWSMFRTTSTYDIKLVWGIWRWVVLPIPKDDCFFRLKWQLYPIFLWL
jgi:hypothetical protein